MSTGYGYAPTGGQDTVDYAGIGVKAGEDIFNEIDKREAKRTAIDTQEQKDLTKLKDVPQGDDQSYNTFLLNYGADSSTAMLQLNKELKSGKLSLRDFSIRRQNMMDASDHILKLGDNYNKAFRESLDGINSGKYGEEERNKWAQLQKMVDWNSTKSKHNSNGTVSIIGGDGNELSTTQLSGIMGAHIPKYDLNGESAKLSKAYAPYVEALYKDPKYKTISDVRLAPGYQQKMDGEVGSLLVNPQIAGSVLADNSNGIDGKRYHFTKDPEEAAKDKTAILQVRDPENKSSGQYVNQLSSDQMKVAKELVQGSIERGFKHEEVARTEWKPDRPYKPTVADQKEAAKAEGLDNLGKALTGSQASRDVYANKIKVNKGFDSVDFSEKSLSWVKNGIPNSIDFTGKTPVQIATIMSDFTGVENPEQLIRKYKIGSFGGEISKGTSTVEASGNYAPSWNKGAVDPATKTEGTSPEGVFDNKVIENSGAWSSTGNEEWQTSYVTGVTKSLNLLPKKLQKDMNVTMGGMGTKKPVLNIKLPSASDNVISIPLDKSTKVMKEQVKLVIAKIYNAAMSGGKVDLGSSVQTTTSAKATKSGKTNPFDF